MNRLRNDLYCVGWGVKLYSIQFSRDDAGDSAGDMYLQNDGCLLPGAVTVPHTPVEPVVTQVIFNRLLMLSFILILNWAIQGQSEADTLLYHFWTPCGRSGSQYACLFL